MKANSVPRNKLKVASEGWWGDFWGGSSGDNGDDWAGASNGGEGGNG